MSERNWCRQEKDIARTGRGDAGYGCFGIVSKWYLLSWNATCKREQRENKGEFGYKSASPK